MPSAEVAPGSTITSAAGAAAAVAANPLTRASSSSGTAARRTHATGEPCFAFLCIPASSDLVRSGQAGVRIAAAPAARPSADDEPQGNVEADTGTNGQPQPGSAHREAVGPDGCDQPPRRQGGAEHGRLDASGSARPGAGLAEPRSVVASGSGKTR